MDGTLLDKNLLDIDTLPDGTLPDKLMPTLPNEIWNKKKFLSKKLNGKEGGPEGMCELHYGNQDFFFSIDNHPVDLYLISEKSI